MAMMIQAEGLAKSFGTTLALDGIDLEVESGPELLVFLVVQPILFVLLFVYVFGGAISSSIRRYRRLS